MQEVVIRPEVDVAASAGNDAAADRGVETKRVADSDYPIAHLRGNAIAPTYVGKQVICIDFEERKIRLGVTPGPR